MILHTKLSVHSYFEFKKEKNVQFQTPPYRTHKAMLDFLHLLYVLQDRWSRSSLTLLVLLCNCCVYINVTCYSRSSIASNKIKRSSLFRFKKRRSKKHKDAGPLISTDMTMDTIIDKKRNSPLRCGGLIFLSFQI